ncbi:MAG: hypothetical protein O9277_02170 [Magnetospirillum sp.]|nr:hypothetical protein [Magnetospirillum sp.]
MTKSKSDATHARAPDASEEKPSFGMGATDVLQLQKAVAEATQEILSTAARFGMRRMAAVGNYAATLCACKSPADIGMANIAYWQRYLVDLAEQTQEASKTTNESIGSALKLAAE